MLFFPCRCVVMYRLCSVFYLGIIFSYFSVVLSSNKDLSKSKFTEYVNLNLGEPLTISFSKYNENYKKNNSLLLTDEVIENMDVLLPMQTVPLVITEIPSTVHFIITEVHTFSHYVTLGYQQNKLDPHSYVTGKNIGLVNMTDEGLLTNVTLFLENNSDHNVTILIAVTVHNKSVPIPGGCNMEFQTEIAPYLLLNYTDSIVTLLNQPAAMPPTFIKKKQSCQIPPGTLLHYETYHMYLPEGDFSEETYFHSIRSMISVQRIHQNGRKIPVSLLGPSNKRLFSAYLGTGSVFGVVVYTMSSVGDKNDVFLTSAAYVPTLTYACCPDVEVNNNCEVFRSELAPWIFIMVFIFGFFLTMCGHVYFKTQMFIFGALTSGIISHILVINFLSITPTASTSISALSLIFGGLLWLKVWSWFGLPIVSILLPLFNAGVLASALLFYCFSNSDEVQPIIQSDANFWMALFTTSLMYVTVLLFIAEAHNASIFTSALFGGFMMIMTLDYVIGSNLKYIVVNLYRRLTIPEFNKAVIDPPIQNPDIVLLVLWIALVITGSCTQLVFSAGKPPFPPPSNRRLYDHYNQRVVPNAVPVEIDSGSNSHNNGEVNEITPLLSNPHN